MEIKTSSSYKFSIYIAGDRMVAESYLREYVNRVGLCVSIQDKEYIYTGGKEEGLQIDLINYPRFDNTKEELWLYTIDITENLIGELDQVSATIVGPEESMYISIQDEIDGFN